MARNVDLLRNSVCSDVQIDRCINQGDTGDMESPVGVNIIYFVTGFVFGVAMLYLYLVS